MEKAEEYARTLTPPRCDNIFASPNGDKIPSVWVSALPLYTQRMHMCLPLWYNNG